MELHPPTSALAAGAAAAHIFGCDEAPSWVKALDTERLCSLASSGDAEAVSSLLTHGCTPGGTNSDGECALLVALKHAPVASRAGVVSVLLERGADPNQADREHCTPLLAAACIGDTSAVQLLLDRNASIDAPNMSGFRALHAAAQMGNPDCVRLLLDRRAAIDAPTRAGGTPLVVACMQGELECARLLLRRGASVNGASRGPTPLHSAAERGHDGVLALVIGSGADLGSTCYGKTALVAARRGGFTSCVKLLTDATEAASSAADAAAAALIAEEEAEASRPSKARGKKKRGKKAVAVFRVEPEGSGSAAARPAGAAHGKSGGGGGGGGGGGDDGGGASASASGPDSAGASSSSLTERLVAGLEGLRMEASASSAGDVGGQASVGAGAEPRGRRSEGKRLGRRQEQAQQQREQQAQWQDDGEGPLPPGLPPAVLFPSAAEMSSSLSTLSPRSIFPLERHVGASATDLQWAAEREAIAREEAEAVLLCVVCLDEPKTRACVPCGHVCACERCAAPLKQCPICREDCVDIMRIYLS